MEEKINIAEILKDKQQGTKLYSILSDGECFLNEVSEDSIYIDIDNRKRFWCFTVYGSTHSFPNGCVLLFPSREMRDWHKFAWKKGDVLISNDGKKEVFFNGFTDDTYALFKAKHGFEVLSNGNTIYLAGEDGIATSDYTLGDKDTAQNYINTIEERLGGKLNRETLKVEPAQPEFKDGDIVTIMPRIGDKLIYLFKAEDNGKYYGHAFLDGNIAIVNEDSYCQKDFSTARPSTEEEKQQLFSALAKKGKAWDAENKEVADLKPKVKPFDRVLVRDSKSDNWRANLFGYIGKDGYYHCVYANWAYCIPYIGNESLLGTTKDVEG
jgi:hypothetical protein